MPFQIIVGSTNEHKLSAVREACSRLGIKCRITGKKGISGQNEQPVGLGETYQGALNRAMSVYQKLTSTGIAIGIESGIVRVETQALTIDLAVIIVITDEGREIVTTSTGIRLPEECVTAAEMKGFGSTTVGSIIAEQLGGDGTNPHGTLTDNAVSRHQTLVDGLIVALTQIEP
jgi:inosine/xanthosine triphosphatase